MGVEATARAAFDLNYDVVIAADACGSVAPGLHAFAVENILPRIARVRRTAGGRGGTLIVKLMARVGRDGLRRELRERRERMQHQLGSSRDGAQTMAWRFSAIGEGAWAV